MEFCKDILSFSIMNSNIVLECVLSISRIIFFSFFLFSPPPPFLRWLFLMEVHSPFPLKRDRAGKVVKLHAASTRYVEAEVTHRLFACLF